MSKTAIMALNKGAKKGGYGCKMNGEAETNWPMIASYQVKNFSVVRFKLIEDM